MASRRRPTPGPRTTGAGGSTALTPRWRLGPPPLERPCAQVSAREAGYLLALHRLARESAEPTQVALARAMGVTPPTAFQMVRRLRRLGLVVRDRMALTPDGVSAALLLASRRRAAFVLTHDLLGLDEQSAHTEADRLAPSLSAELTRRLLATHRRRA